jgi:hypothetical protein
MISRRTRQTGPSFFTLYPEPYTLDPGPCSRQFVISLVPSVISLIEAPGLTMG